MEVGADADYAHDHTLIETPGTDGPVVDVPGVGLEQLPGIDRQAALGDVVSFGLFLPKLKLKKQMIGIGPVVSLPLSSNEAMGSGKWELGPAAVYVNLKTPTIQWGALAYQLWDVVDSQQDRASVSKFFIQPFITRYFKKGWYLSTQDALWSYDWNSKEWNIPLGFRFGKVTKFGQEEPIEQRLLRRAAPAHAELAGCLCDGNAQHHRRRLRLLQGQGGREEHVRRDGAEKDPCDWCAVTDHAEYFGVMPQLSDPKSDLMVKNKDNEIIKLILCGDPKKGDEAFAKIAVGLTTNNPDPVFNFGTPGATGVWALKDPDSGNLDRVQIIKGWYENGYPQEKVYDVVWSDNREIDQKTGELPRVGNTVNIKEATYTNDIGDTQLSATWTDPDFKPEHHAVY